MASTEIATLNYFGVTFTPTNILASRFKADGSFELIRYPASHEYLSYYQNMIRNIDQPQNLYGVPKFDGSVEYNAAVSIFRSAIRPVTHDLQRQLGLNPTYASLYLPSIFHNNIISAAATAILPTYEENINTMQGPHRRAALWGFHFLEGKHIGPVSEECDRYCPESLVLLLEYEKDYLYAWLMVVDPELGNYYTQAGKLCVECGELFREEPGIIVYQQRISGFLRNFINEQSPQDYQREDIRAIVAAGEASAQGVSSLRAIAMRVVDMEEVKLITAIEPENVVAHGAVFWAQKSHQDPDPWWSCPSRTPVYHSPQLIGQNIPMYNKLIEAGDGPRELLDAEKQV